jgi:cytochrome c oxidase subunit IV
MTQTIAHVWLKPAVGWFALLAMLTATIGVAYAPLGGLSILLNLLIAGLCVGLIGIIFMNLAESSVLVRLASGAGIFWLLFMFIMTAGDYLSR